MKIVALYKIWSGEEWLMASIKSIINHVDQVVLLTSNVSWIGGRGNPSLPMIPNLFDLFPGKISHINFDEPNQIKHCMEGYNYIKKNLPCDYIQLIDSDELWDNENYKKAIQFLTDHPNYDAYRTQMYTYLKSPFYRVDPPESLKPVCFIKTDRPDMGAEPRGCGIHPFIIMPDVWCHHYVFVRENFNKVLEKLIQSHVSEKQPYHDMSKWVPEIWNKIPNSTENMHPAIGFAHHWKRIRKISLEELPEILRLKEFEHILKYGK